MLEQNEVGEVRVLGLGQRGLNMNLSLVVRKILGHIQHI
jgi:hypothetical protein